MALMRQGKGEEGDQEERFLIQYNSEVISLEDKHIPLGLCKENGLHVDNIHYVQWPKLRVISYKQAKLPNFQSFCNLINYQRNLYFV